MKNLKLIHETILRNNQKTNLMKHIPKRILCFILTLFIFAFVGVPSVSAETEGPFQYYVFDGEARIDKCDQSIQGHLDIPETLGGAQVVSIGYDAFIGCKNLTSITIPESVTTLVGGAFQNTGLTSVFIPKTLTRIDQRAFKNCFSLTAITVDEENPNYLSIDGVLFTKDLKELKQYPNGKTDSFYTVPQGVEQICYAAFNSNSHLREIVLPNTVTEVKVSFFNCANLTKVTVPPSVAVIDTDAFGIAFDMELDDWYRVPGFMIHGYAGTQAEQHAIKYLFDFYVLNQKGDNNHDDMVNAKDALIALQLAVNKIESTPGLIQVTDVNGDTFVNTKDALEILKKTVGKPTCF